jgi:Spore coat assembly protein
MKISLNDEELFNGNIAIEIRGKSSQMFPKKQYGFETRDEENEDMDVSLLDMPEEEDWILQAPYSDKSLIRNALIYDISREIGRYASRVKFVELTLNDVNDGVYVFMEKLKRDKNRIDINKLKTSEINGEDLTGGYIIKIDKPDDQYNSINSFVSEHSPYDPSGNNSVRFLYDTPDEEDITSEQKEYISNYVKDFENALAGENFTDPVQGYDAYIDSDDFIDFFLLNELSNNVDGFRISTWIVKDKNEKMRMGPIWDFNLAFGNADYCSGGESNVWAYKLNERCPGGFWPIPIWWERLLQDPAYVLK